MSRNKEIKNLIKEIVDYYDEKPGEEVNITLTQEGYENGLPGKVFTFSDPQIIDSLVKYGLFNPKPPRFHPHYIQPGKNNISVFEGVFYLKKANQWKERFSQIKISPFSISNLLDMIPDNKKNRIPRSMAELLCTGNIVSDFDLARCFERSLTRKRLSDNPKKYARLTLNRLKTLKKYWKRQVQIKRVRLPIQGFRITLL